MHEDELFSWFERNKRALRSFDADSDGEFSYQEVRWAVRTAIRWAERAREEPERRCWYYAYQKKVNGPYSWRELTSFHESIPFAFCRDAEEASWLPWVILDRLVTEDTDSSREPEQSAPHQAGVDPVKDADDHVKEGVEELSRRGETIADPCAAAKLNDLWSDSTYILETTGYLRGYHTGTVYDSRKNMLLKIRPLIESEHTMMRLSRDWNRMGRVNRRHSNRILANSVHLITASNLPLYHIKRRYHAGIFPYGTELYSMTNSDLGQVLQATYTSFSLGFDSWGTIDRGSSETTVRVRGPFWHLRFLIGGRVVARIIPKVPGMMDWVVKNKNMYVLKMLEKRISPSYVIAYLIAAKSSFWWIDSRQRA